MEPFAQALFVCSVGGGEACFRVMFSQHLVESSKIELPVSIQVIRPSTKLLDNLVSERLNQRRALQIRESNRCCFPRKHIDCTENILIMSISIPVVYHNVTLHIIKKRRS